jgi:hypothetical protein
MNSNEALKIQQFLKKKLGNDSIGIRPRADDVSEDSAEVTLDGEFLGVVFKDTEDGDTCYHFQWTIIEEDLGD